MFAFEHLDFEFVLLAEFLRDFAQISGGGEVRWQVAEVFGQGDALGDACGLGECFFLSGIWGFGGEDGEAALLVFGDFFGFVFVAVGCVKFVVGVGGALDQLAEEGVVGVVKHDGCVA